MKWTQLLVEKWFIKSTICNSIFIIFQYTFFFQLAVTRLNRPFYSDTKYLHYSYYRITANQDCRMSTAILLIRLPEQTFANLPILTKTNIISVQFYCKINKLYSEWSQDSDQRKVFIELKSQL